MIRSELDAAGIEGAELRSAYRRCREINSAHGRTFFLATRLLAPEQRPPVHALYGFARYADDILDDLNPTLDAATREARLQQLSDQFFAHRDHSTEPVLTAVNHTAHRYGIDRDLLMWCHTHGCTDPRVRDALADQHDITRGVYRYAERGISLLGPRSRACVATALTLYSEILDRIEDSDFDVFGRRATVGAARRIGVAGTALLRSWRARLMHPAPSADHRSGVA